MPATYDLGDSVKLTFTVRDEAGALIDATVAILVTKPDGSTTVPSITHPGTGTYTALIAPDQAGLWLYKWTATGAATTAEDGQLYVEPNATQDVYATLNEVLEQLGDSLTAPKLPTGLLEKAIRAASRAVDGYCGRRFWLDPVAVAHTYQTRPDSYYDPLVLLVDDIGTTSGLLVKTDTAGDGSFATTWAASDYQLEPLNTAVDGGGYAWWRIRAIAGKTFPYSWRGRPTVQITARHGWSQIPDPVREAALLKAVKLFKRRESPDGFIGVADFGSVRISRFEDPDVAALLNPYARPGFG